MFAKKNLLTFICLIFLLILTSCTPTETVSVVKVVSDIVESNISSATEQSNISQIPEVSEEVSTSSEDYKLDRTITIDGKVYNLKYVSTDKKSGGQWNDSHLYMTDNAEIFTFDVLTDKLLSFTLYLNEYIEQTISEEQAIKIAEDFFRTQVDLDLYQRRSVQKKKTNSEEYFVLYYDRYHLGYRAEHIDINISVSGKIRSYGALVDPNNVVHSIKEIDETKVKQAIANCVPNSDFNYNIDHWLISKNYKPALYVSCRFNNGTTFRPFVVEIYSDGTYSAYEESVAYPS